MTLATMTRATMTLATMTRATMTLATNVADALRQSRRRIVFAESCTCGMVACELGQIPGISAWLCGSAVTYQSETKSDWLDVDPLQIETHTAVSVEVARAMAVGVLAKTPRADLSTSITGHFGPDSPDGLDGVVFIGVAQRDERGKIGCTVTRHRLDTSDRRSRQTEATELVFRTVLRALE